MSQPTDDITHLIGEYARLFRRVCVAGQEVEIAHAFVDALTNPDSRQSNARRLQRIRAVNMAASQVRTERLLAALANEERSVPA